MFNFNYIMRKRKLNVHSQELKDNYSNFLMDNKKSSEDIYAYLNDKFDIRDVTNNDNCLYLEKKLARKNVFNSWYNEAKNLKESDFIFSSYIIIENTKSKEYYTEEFKQNFLDNEIYVIIETNTGMVYSNNSSLQDELHLYRGVNSIDINNNTPDLSLYLLLLDSKYNKKE